MNVEWLKRESPFLLALLVPIILTLGAVTVRRRGALAHASRVTSFAAVIAVAAAVARALAGVAAPEVSLHGLVALGAASCLVLVLVAGLGSVVARYSVSYLVGEPGLARYARALLLLLACVTSLVTTNHLLVVVAAWGATSACLHVLLTFYRERTQALVAAHKKFLLSRLADVCVLGAVALFGHGAGTLHIDELLATTHARPELGGVVHAGAVMLVLGVALKSAQLPFHGWMTQVMEAPTPVSALLHAGVVNIGGFVLIRLSPLMARAPMAEWLLLAVGLVTTAAASLVMTTRTSVKVALAWSTIAQMGFMLVQCAVGAPHLALLHLLAHSAYKAHAFLGAGGAVGRWRGQSLVRVPRPAARDVAAGAALACLVVGLTALTSSVTGAALGSGAAFITMLALALAPMLSRAVAAGRAAAARGLVSAVGVGCSFFAVHAVFAGATLGVDRSAEAAGGRVWIAVGVLGALYAAQVVLQLRPEAPFSMWLSTRLSLGMHLDARLTKWSFRVFPPRPPRPRDAAGARADLTSTPEIPSC